jgi:hypothetical protein
MEATAETLPWSNLKKIAFRFAATYFIIYMGASASEMVGAPFEPVVQWVGKSILHMSTPIDAKQNGSGDTSYYYVVQFISMVLTVVASIVWTIADRRRTSYHRMLYWITAMVRYYLAFFLLVYGYSKFSGGQFSTPGLARLIQPYGESSPMGLAWTFLGFSPAFGVFMGVFESLGGVLMLFRRTTLLGACIATTVTTNIVLINFCYDVPVKLFSSHLLLMCIFVIAVGGKRLLDFFLFNKPVPPEVLSPVFHSRKWKITRIVVKIFFILFVTVFPIVLIINENAEYGDEAKPALYGIYAVQEFIRNNDTIPPLTTDSTRWDKLLIEYEGSAVLYTMTGQKKFVALETDTALKILTMYSYNDTAHKYTLSYTFADSTLMVNGLWKQDTVSIRMHLYDEKKLLLVNRGFHWINEYPFNR